MNVHHFIKCGALMLLFYICGLTARAQTQTVTLNLRNVSLKQVFGAIEKQTTYRFSYRNVVIDERRDITVSRTNATVQAVLDAVLEGRNLEYKIVSSKSIVISDKPASKASGSAQGDWRRVSGTVKDSHGDPIVGASVYEKGTKNGTLTDVDGRFSSKTFARMETAR